MNPALTHQPPPFLSPPRVLNWAYPNHDQPVTWGWSIHRGLMMGKAARSTCFKNGDSADFCRSGRAAAEGQLRRLSTGAKKQTDFVYGFVDPEAW